LVQIEQVVHACFIISIYHFLQRIDVLVKVDQSKQMADYKVPYHISIELVVQIVKLKYHASKYIFEVVHLLVYVLYELIYNLLW